MLALLYDEFIANHLAETDMQGEAIAFKNNKFISEETESLNNVLIVRIFMFIFLRLFENSRMSCRRSMFRSIAVPQT